MQPTTVDPRYIFDLTPDPNTGEYIANFPALNLSQRGTFDEVSEWAMEELARQYGIVLLPKETETEQVKS